MLSDDDSVRILFFLREREQWNYELFARRRRWKQYRIILVVSFSLSLYIYIFFLQVLADIYYRNDEYDFEQVSRRAEYVVAERIVQNRVRGSQTQGKSERHSTTVS